jgi:hypothetical protein
VGWDESARGNRSDEFCVSGIVVGGIVSLKTTGAEETLPL